MKEGTSPEVPKARESRGEPRVGRVRGSGPCRGVIERPGGSRHDTVLNVPKLVDVLSTPPRPGANRDNCTDVAVVYHSQLMRARVHMEVGLGAHLHVTRVRTTRARPT